MRKKGSKYQPASESVIAARNFLATLFGQKYFAPVVFILLFLFVLVSGWLPETVASIFPHKTQMFIKTGATVIFFIILVYYGLKAKKYLAPLQVITDDANPPIAKVLLLFLSPLGGQGNLRNHLLDDLYKIVTDPEKNDKDKKDARDNLQNNMKSPNPPWSWEMPAIAIAHHAPRLESVYVVPSEQTINDYDYFKKFVTVYFYGQKFGERSINDIVFNLWPKPTTGIRFDAIDKIFECVNGFYDRLNKIKIRPEDAVVDITSGMVPTSVGAAIATMTRGRQAEYVHTRDKKVISYDITYRED